ncbi:hypothetical protein A3A95_02895 [Candidatus Nomurabacteria bacterium RIFCSPLOWO2_01_FULL_39_18]|uniref:Homing endonuclease LAGLIDADG domain-containing protein n=1 Tax=Candidatus Nomurabacteria bacterium RIFCSPHIGHO2_01_FULL_40_24b TaxID=1801739 RepID=A0A1F6V7U2_9BACT|nr:MAG: hypothetical protein A2647_03670 [Candidatus Nomurabacteria bacterium RIFCSPHIGHO2_01_FULL_40_24b]OGI89609.1 MAG: hypothetical protein A3A95_02895 [Candidatus Nomurabacteria bacterium RIFCSPLOWO2_01_FULL_39_18]
MDKKILENLYITKKLSSADIARKFSCSETKINYWLAFHKIKKRTISEAIYQKNNPKGDPFLFNRPRTRNQMFLFGLGLGLYWGEGTKRNLHMVRLGNSDPQLIKKFIDFLVDIYNINKKRLRFQLQIYDDLNSNELLKFWAKYLSVKNTQFSKTTILKRRGKGTYLEKMKYGVIIVGFGNVKLRNLICAQIANMENL